MGNKALVTVENDILKISYKKKVQCIPLSDVKRLKIYDMMVFTFEYNDGHKIKHRIIDFTPWWQEYSSHGSRIKQECRKRNIPTVHYGERYIGYTKTGYTGF